MNTRFLILTLLLLISKNALSQDLPTIVPLSPNAASIAKYGEIPVGHFTGIPSIGIPIYTVSSGELTLPLSLSYHAGGNRVESVASWVGLGWSLGSIPSISRNVRGIPDEKPGGYFSKYSGTYTVEALWNLPSGNSTFEAYRHALYDGTADSEPDIFNYSLPGESGKFFYNQDEQEFITYPKSNTKIERDGTGYKLTTQGGVEYVFNVIESTTGSNAMNTSWYASKMMSASKKDTIRFTYQIESHVTKTKNVVTKYHYLAGLSNGVPSDDGTMFPTNNTYAMVVDSIVFDKGYIKFNKNGTGRADLNGGYSLNNVSVYNNQNQLINKHEFTYRFKQGSGAGACTSADTFSRNWMLLDKVDQVSTISSSDKLSHLFTYNETYIPACRYSAAQDYWGYYNGQDSNADLTPPYYIPNVSTQISGADREVNPTYSKFGVLKKITYPTGGYTEFDFENNMAYANDLPLQYVSDYQSMAGEEYFDVGETIPATSTFTKTLIINNPSDPVLNNNNPNGGATVNFTIGLPGCDLSGGSNPCAEFTIKGALSGSSTYYIPIEGTSFYLPNDTYTIKAEFDQSNPLTPQYQDFYYIVDWQEIDPNSTGNTYIGGLRIKEIRSYANATSQPITKKYKYTTAYNSTVSSGDIFSSPNFSHTDVINYQNGVQSQGGYDNSSLLRVRSTSNIQQVTHSGSAVGYKTVFEETDDPNKTGYTEYQYAHVRDEEFGESLLFPYAPAISFELERGLLTNQKWYKKFHSSFDLVQEKHLVYTSTAFDTGTVHPKSSFGIKWGNLRISTVDPIDWAEHMANYNVVGGWRSLSYEINTSYYDNGSSATSINHFYDNPTHLLKTKTETIDSRGVRTISKVKYPQDISSPPSAITGLITQNRLAEAIETKSYKDLDNDGIADANELLSTQQNDYRVWYNSLYDVISPEFIKTSKGSNALENRIVFQSYYDDGKVKEVSKADGTHITYIWGYDKTLPVAKVENATYSQVSSYVSNIQSKANLDDDNCMDSSTCDEKNLRTALAGLRNISGAMVTTYTYDPLKGVTSMTDPRGQTVYYFYDGFNRLTEIKDAYEKIVSHNQYNYKN